MPRATQTCWVTVTGMPFKLKETNVSTKHDRITNLNWWEADQLVIYKHDRAVELGSTEKQGRGLEHATSGFQVQCQSFRPR